MFLPIFTEVSGFESEKTLTFSIEEIQEATANFDESRKIGEGGYGIVYHGVLNEQVFSLFSSCSFTYTDVYIYYRTEKRSKFIHNCFFNLQEVAIKKMKSNKSKEFFAELKVLCRIHHINVVTYTH